MSDKLRPEISTANMKLESGDVDRVAGVGSCCLIICVAVVMEFRPRVSKIMLANPMMIVMMIANEMRPPVSVRYYISSSNLSNLEV